MVQTREKWDALNLSRVTFEWYESAMVFRIFVFIFCLETMVREQMHENDFHHYYGNFFESIILKRPHHSHVQSSFAAIIWKFDNIWKTSYRWKFYGPGSSSVPILYWLKSLNENQQKCLENYNLHKNPSLLLKENCFKTCHV